jgi:hypothetical protein
MTAALAERIEFPVGYDRDRILRPLFLPDGRPHPLWAERDRGRQVWTPEGAYFRRHLTRRSPLLFALTYFGPWMTDQRGRITMAELHMALFRIVARWAEPGPHRDGLAAWREAGKSTITCGIGPPFVIAHGHRKFPHVFSLRDKQANGKLKRLVDTLHGKSVCSELLLADFPELAPVRGAGGEGRTVLENGAVIAGRGMNVTTLGEVAGDAGRPDLLVVDDPQPKASENNERIVEQAKDTLRTALFPMGRNAAVMVTGTVTHKGCLMDDVVQLAQGKAARSEDKGRWLLGERFSCHYFPLDWPAQFPPEKVERMRAEARRSPQDARAHALNYEPHLLDTLAPPKYWPRPEGWQYGWKWSQFTEQRVISVDPAVTVSATADNSAIAVLAIDTSRRRICVEHVEAGRWSWEEINARIHKLHAATLRTPCPADTVIVEINQGGDGALSGIGPYPHGCRPIGYRVEAPKAQRIEHLHGFYVSRAIWHLTELAEYEAEAEAWHPKAKRDDRLDAVSGGVRFLLTGDPTM